MINKLRQLNKSQLSDFEKELEEQKETIELAGETIEFIDLTPKKLKNETPVLIVPGLAENIEVIQPSIEELYKRGRRVLSLSHSINAEDISLDNTDINFPKEELKKAVATLRVLDEKNLDKIDVVAHSEGAINISIAATLKPEKFRNIVLVSPGGMVGEEEFKELRERFVDSLKRAIKIAEEEEISEEKKEILQTKLINILKYVTQNPVTALKEAKAISNSKIEKSLIKLDKKGIGISILHGEDDPIFPIEKVKKVVEENGIKSFHAVDGKHSDMYLEAPRYMKIVDNILDNLERED